MRSRPDILVLGSGGVLGEAWLSGVLAGIEDAAGLELSRCEYFTGTSAGSIVAARLAAGIALERPASDSDERVDPSSEARHASWDWSALPASVAGRLAGGALALSSPFVPPALALTAPAGSLARALALRAAPRAGGSLGELRRRVDETGARFDGRLRVVALARATGRRVVFGRPHAPHATVGQAVEASCSVPWLFAPVVIDRVEYVDGGFWSPTNLDAAPAARGSLVLCLSPTAGVARSDRLALQPLGVLSRSVTAVEAAALRHRGAEVELVAPDDDCAAAIGRDLMDRTRRATVLAAAYRQGRALGGQANGTSVRSRRRGPQATTPSTGTGVTGR